MKGIAYLKTKFTCLGIWTVRIQFQIRFYPVVGL